MTPVKMHIPQNVQELLELLGSMLLSSPKFLDKTGYLPFLNLDYVFQELYAGLTHNRKVLGEDRFNELMSMSNRMRAHFEADPENKTGETRKGRDIIYEMEDVLSQIRRSGSGGSKTGTRAFENFPYEIVDTNGENALATWEELKSAGRGVPIVLGDDLENLLAPFHRAESARHRPIEEILAAANGMRFPDDLLKLRQEETAEAIAYFKNITPPGHKEYETPLGEWPTETSPSSGETSPSSGLSVVYSTLTGHPRPMVHIALIPTDDPTTIPAHMRWGNWNECPPPAYHVAALRAWGDRYGAELVGLGADTINLRVSRNPATRDEALELARVQYAYCSDIIDQGVRTYRALAAGLMAHDWWYFWWG